MQHLQTLWWQQAEANQVLPLDDRFAPRFAETPSAIEVLVHMHSGLVWATYPAMSHQICSRSYRINVDVEILSNIDSGVLIAHGDATGGYSLYMDKGHLVHDLNIGGTHQLLTTTEPVLPGRRELTFVMQRKPKDNSVVGRASLVDGIEAAQLHTDSIFNNDSWSGLDIGFDRGTPWATTRRPSPLPASCAKSQWTLATTKN